MQLNLQYVESCSNNFGKEKKQILLLPVRETMLLADRSSCGCYAGLRPIPAYDVCQTGRACVRGVVCVCVLKIKMLLYKKI